MVLIVVVSVMSSLVMNRYFLTPYYYRQQEELLETAVLRISEVYQGERNEEVDERLDALVYELNGLILLTDAEGTVLYSSHSLPARYGNTLSPEVLLEIRESGIPRITGPGGRGAGQHSRPPRPEQDLVTKEIVLSGGHGLLVQVPLGAIDTSIAIFSRFSLYPAIVAFCTALFAAAILSRRLARPIVDLRAVAERMRKLDFSARYVGRENDEIGDLGRSFNAMGRALEGTVTQLNEANRQLQEDIRRKKDIEEARRDFISGVSHELKTPVSLIRGYAEGLRDGIAEPGERQNYLDVIVDESENMSRLVQDLLELTRLESGQPVLHREDRDYREIVRKGFDRFQLDFERETIQARISLPGEAIDASFDPGLMERALQNLLTNAIDHADGARRVWVEAEASGAWVRTVVGNTGPPIEDGELERIWESFTKTDPSRNRAFGGTGLGLSIVRGIVERHGGRCGVQNRKDGVLFWMEIPQNPASPGSPEKR